MTKILRPQDMNAAFAKGFNTRSLQNLLSLYQEDAVRLILHRLPATLELAALSDEVSESRIAFSFKHFQSFPEAGRFGELQLPEGFEPRQVKVQAEVEGDKPLSRTFEWIKSGAIATHVE